MIDQKITPAEAFNFISSGKWTLEDFENWMEHFEENESEEEDERKSSVFNGS